MTSGVAQLNGLALTLEISLEFGVFTLRTVSIVNVNMLFPRSLIWMSINNSVPINLYFIVNLSKNPITYNDDSISNFMK